MTLRSVIVRQFRHPQGLLGYLAGLIMASRPSNRQRNAWTVGLLGLEPRHRVLEIGCGPGLALKACAAKVTEGRVVGLDHSPLMVRQARRRLATEIAADRAQVRLGDVTDMAQEPATYDRVVSLNVVQFFPDLNEVFGYIHTCLVDGGTVATTFQPRSKNPTREEAMAMAQRIEAAMDQGEFTDIQCHELSLEPAPAVCVTGVKIAGYDRK